MQKENLSFTQQKLFPLVWEGWLRRGPPLCLPRVSPGRGRVQEAVQPCGWMERAGAPAPAAGKALLGSVVSPSREEGWERRCPGLPGELAWRPSAPAAQAARALVFVLPELWCRCPGLVCAPGQPDADGGAQSLASAARAVCSSGYEMPVDHPSTQMPFSSHVPLPAGLWRGERDMVTEPLLDLRQPDPQPTPPPLFHDAKGPLLGDVLDAEGSANSAPRAPGCCNLFMPTAQEVPDGG